MEKFYRRAIRNIARHGDTDIFPFPIENHVLHDLTDRAVEILARLDADVRGSLAKHPPMNVGALAPVGYTGFRWATQIDPIWNVAYLSWVLSIADQIEAARIPLDRQRVFSYRYEWDDEQATCFNRRVTWRTFVDRAIEKAATSNFVVNCDISEFYPRINHHRIDNSIQHLPNAAYAIAAAEEGLTGLRFLSAVDLDESSALAKRMCFYLFHVRQDRVVLNPQYDGCGIINACFGDAISDNEHIIELKDGDRPFRSYEFRQITIYGALHLNRTGRLPPAFAVINSRRGVSVELPIDTFAREVAGQSGYDYLREVIRVISDVTISR